MPTKVIYALARETYFLEGARGRVAHAAGVVSGLTSAGVRVEVISGPGAENFIDRACIFPVSANGNSGWLAELKSTVRQRIAATTEPTTLIVRYGVKSGFRMTSLFKSRNEHVRSCFEVNSLLYHEGLTARWPRFLRERLLRVECMILNQADVAYVISARIGSDIQRGGYRGRIAVVPNGGPDAINLVASRKSGGLQFVFFGVFQKYYNLDILLEAYQRFRNRGGEAELVLHGDGPQYDHVKERASTLNGVRCTGRFIRDNLFATELDSAHTVLLLPLRSESLGSIVSPIKLYEYMATGLPVIASASGTLGSVLIHDDNALLVTHDDADAWADAMLRLATEGETRRMLSSNIRTSYEGHTWNARMHLLKSELDQLHY